MLRSFVFVLGVGCALGGVSIQMPYLHPAGVTYSGLPAAVHGVPAHLAYSAATTSSVAYGNAAFLASRGYAHALPIDARVAPVAHVAAPVAHVAAPVVPTVHHVPAVAQVPVTKYEAQPAVIQNLVDVAKPKLASRKIEIRRPAIQKEFYDVEERVIIRPAGSAVVELDQPVSKSQRGPTVVQPALHAVATHAVAHAPVVGFRSYHPAHHLIPAAYPASFSVHPYPIQGPAAIPVSSTPAPEDIQGQHEEIPQEFAEQQPAEEEQQQFTQPIPEQPAQPFPQQPPQQEPQQFDDSDSVAIDNPDIARVRSQQPQRQLQFQDIQQQQQQQPQDLFRSFQPQTRVQLSATQQQQEQQLRREQQMLAEFTARAQQRLSSRQQSVAQSQVEAQEQVVAQLQAQTQAQQAQLERSQQILQLQQQQLDRSRQAAQRADEGEQQQRMQMAPAARSQSDDNEGLPSFGPAPQRQQESRDFGVEAADLRSALINNAARASSSPSVIPSFRISPEQSLSNQERLISLLTARGGVVEARSAGQLSESHQVRARVLSVTPAPDNAAPREEKVNTRRIVVSRPIQTVEEVNVVEPFTKIERVAVHSPALIKTARLGVAHVPTSLPVHGYAHAIPTATVAY